MRVALESILGLQIEGGHTLVLNPCLSSSWPECRLQYRWPVTNAELDIRIHNPDRRQSGVRQASVNGKQLEIHHGTMRLQIEPEQPRYDLEVQM